MAHSPLETFRRLANAGIFRVVKQAQPVLKTMPQLVADLMGALRSLRKVDTVVTARDGSRTVEALHEGTVKLSLARSAAFDPPVLENAVLQSRWSMLPHSDLPVATAAATLVVLDFDCTLTVRHMYHWLRTSAGKQVHLLYVHFYMYTYYGYTYYMYSCYWYAYYM
jgi:hypothetical protein